MNEYAKHTPPLELEYFPQRIVSLLPSMTQTIIDLGAGDRLVGVTDFCPLEALGESIVDRVGGPKNPDVEKVINLKPDLVLANREENTPSTVQALTNAGIPVWVTFPCSTMESMEVLWSLIGHLRLESMASARLHALQKTLDWALTARQSIQPVKTFCPIWQDTTGEGEMWWMTFNQDTYAHDVLACCGGENIFADRLRRYPLDADLGHASEEEAGGRDQRYPRVTAEEIVARQPEVVLLPDEPYRFNQDDLDEFKDILAETPAVRQNRVHLVDGALLTWHGTYLAQALARLPVYFSPQ
jgi:iron complex transport system substrate-binding protein